MFSTDDYPLLVEPKTFRADHYVPEPPPRPGLIVGQMAMVVGIVLYMACMITFIAWAFGGTVPD